MKPGDYIERAWWVFDGTSEQAAEAVLEYRITEEFRNEGWTCSPIRYEKLPPDSQRLTDPPPEGIQGRNPYVILGWAEAVAPLPQFSFTSDMTDEDIERLRGVVQKQWARYYPGERLPDATADAVIDGLTPETLRSMLH